MKLPSLFSVKPNLATLASLLEESVLITIPALTQLDSSSKSFSDVLVIGFILFFCFVIFYLFCIIHSVLST